MSQYSEQYGLALKNYEKNKKTLMAETSEINVLQKHLMEKKQSLAQKKKELVTEQQLIAYLKSKGVSEENDDNNEEYAEAAGALENYYNAAQVAYNSCSCKNIRSRQSKKNGDQDEGGEWGSKTYCPNIKNKKDNLEDDDLELVIQKLSPTSGTR